jgi:putative inorganic carbon (hco3(-)) transporter
MVSTQRATLTGQLTAGFGVVGIGLLVGLAADLALMALSPAKVVFALVGFALLIPTMVVKEPQAYWLFLLVLSIPFDISKWLSLGMADSQALVDAYGQPMSGTLGLEVYVTDVVLVVMLLPWLARVCLKQTTIYFPKMGYLFVIYLAWSLFVSLVNSVSFALSAFELFRECLYFVSFVYIVNNVSTRLQFKRVVLAIFFGLTIGAGSVIVFFQQGISTETVAFANLHDEPAASAQTQSHSSGRKESGPHILTLNEAGRHFGSAGNGDTKRSQGMFRHPAIPAGLCGLILPIVLAYLMTAQRARDRILFFLVYVWGFVALLLTFSRAGFIGFMAGALVFLAVGGSSGLISRRLATRSGIAAILLIALSMPLLLVYIQSRPGSFFMRFNMFEAAIKGYSQHPILGVGLNNSTAAMRPGRQELRDLGIPAPLDEPADSFYLAVFTEIGPIGSLLFFGFFCKIIIVALRSTREVSVDLKPLLVGMIAGLAGLATQSIADGPTAGHAVSGTLWLFAGLIFAIRRYSEPKDTPRGQMSARQLPRFEAPGVGVDD